MSSEWHDTTLGQICRFTAGSAFKPEYQGKRDGQYPFIKVSDMNLAGNEIFISGANNYVSKEECLQMKAKTHPSGATVFAKIGVALQSNRRRLLTKPTIIDNNMMSATPIAGVITSRYLYFLLSTLDFNLISAGSALPYLNVTDLQKLNVKLPNDFDEMDGIESFLCALDDRIALLRETNATLEAIAQAIFKSWFVDFDPVRAKQEGRVPEGMDEETAALFPDGFEESELGMIPRGWRISALGSWLSVLETGRRPKGGVSGISDGVPSIGAESIVRIGQYDFSKTKFVSEEFFASMKAGILQSRDVLLYKDGGKPGVFLPRVSMFGDGFPFEKCGINEHVFRMRIKEPFSQTFLYFWIWSDGVMHELKHRGGKAAIPGINQADVREQKILEPTSRLLERFDELTHHLVSQILENSKMSESLSSLRDTLLPRLISGQLRIQDAD